MILGLQVNDPGRAACSWWPEVEAFRDVERFTFKPLGLTVLWGPNGSGKSTVLKTLARLTHCEQGGYSKITQASTWELEVDGARHGDDKQWRDGVALIHDGEPVHFLDPSKEVGMTGGAFDDDFFSDGMVSLRARKTSSGQNVTGMLNRVLKRATEAEKIESAFSRDSTNSVWQANLDKMHEILAPSTVENQKVPRGPRTILLDEPDRSLSIPRQKDLWEALAGQQMFQIIVATHSVFALDLKGAKYIDVQPGYLKECREAVKTLGGGTE